MPAQRFALMLTCEIRPHAEHHQRKKPGLSRCRTNSQMLWRGRTSMKHFLPDVPPYIHELVTILDQTIKAANAPGVRDEVAETSSLEEGSIEEQLRLLGWSAFLHEERGRWVPAPPDLAILHNPPDLFYYLQRCYQLPDHPARWEFLYDGNERKRFKSWEAAYSYLFIYVAQEQSQLPMHRFRVRATGGWAGYDYAARTAEQALILHRNVCIRVFHLSPRNATQLDLSVFKHCGDEGFYCSACACTPCTFSPAEKCPMPAAPGSLAFPVPQSLLQQ
jgi:hypothetical protein